MNVRLCHSLLLIFSTLWRRAAGSGRWWQNDLDVIFGQSIGRDGGGALDHRLAAAVARLWERNDVTNRGAAAEERRQAIKAQRNAAVRWRTVAQRVDEVRKGGRLGLGKLRGGHMFSKSD